ncbi:Rieske (2Fe-2S) protein [Nocardioides bruguierae]|uniref:Cytochrome bc1 complex Rieske iron-sulfur subunit n=1 Tax=Nocardioides bruguierae TaxID=2945102 RepID=A0A9X2D3Y4_9ACTN|nr:Rieske (2Fe-2S) protein [Nocardioides bruguierae]MCM0618883.1 Rieske (2Fe-2S) protein [Nocardioides bruguierae]
MTDAQQTDSSTTDQHSGSTGCCCGAGHGLSRRRALGLGAAGLTAPVLAACGSSEEAATDTEPTATSGEALGAAADVPVGSGVIYTDAEVVVTQPTEGEYKGFSAVCTHQGCIVSQISADGIVCTCHNSVFDVATGEVVSGPAPSPLGSVEVTVDGDEVTVA